MTTYRRVHRIYQGVTDVLERPVAGFEEFVVERGDALYRTALLLAGDPHLAEDLLQTALAKAWRAWAKAEQPEAYVRRILLNTYLSWWRRKWNGEQPTEHLPDSAAQPAAADLDLRAAVRRLPRQQRAVIVLRYFEDLPEREVAALLGCSVGTVKSHAHRALARLGADPAVDNPREDR